MYESSTQWLKQIRIQATTLHMLAIALCNIKWKSSKIIICHNIFYNLLYIFPSSESFASLFRKAIMNDFSTSRIIVVLLFCWIYVFVARNGKIVLHWYEDLPIIVDSVVLQYFANILTSSWKNVHLKQKKT